jgi:hypothetical protein
MEMPSLAVGMSAIKDFIRKHQTSYLHRCTPPLIKRSMSSMTLVCFYMMLYSLGGSVYLKRL